MSGVGALCKRKAISYHDDNMEDGLFFVVGGRLRLWINGAPPCSD